MWSCLVTSPELNNQTDTFSKGHPDPTQASYITTIHSEKLKMQGKIYLAFPPNTHGTSICLRNTAIENKGKELKSKNLIVKVTDTIRSCEPKLTKPLH
jgi:hypothetical protein